MQTKHLLPSRTPKPLTCSLLRLACLLATLAAMLLLPPSPAVAEESAGDPLTRAEANGILLYFYGGGL